jgi:hypothetical protein
MIINVVVWNVHGNIAVNNRLTTYTELLTCDVVFAHCWISTQFITSMLFVIVTCFIYIQTGDHIWQCLFYVRCACTTVCTLYYVWSWLPMQLHTHSDVLLCCAHTLSTSLWEPLLHYHIHCACTVMMPPQFPAPSWCPRSFWQLVDIIDVKLISSNWSNDCPHNANYNWPFCTHITIPESQS